MVYNPIAKQPSLLQVSQFISTSVLYLIYGLFTEKPTQFQNDIQQILSCTQNNVTCPVILTSLLYVQRYVENIKYYGPIPDSCELKIWITALMLADAYLNDAAYATKSWCQVTKIPVDECIRMRRVFLEVVNYDLHVTELQYGTWINDLEHISAHVSSILAYKSQANFNPSQPLLLSQSLLKQPLVTLSPGYSAYGYHSPDYDHSPDYHSMAPTALYYAPVSRVHRLSW